MEKGAEDRSLGLEVKDEVRCSEDNEVFEEAMDHESFSGLDSQDLVNGDGTGKENGEVEVEALEGLAAGEDSGLRVGAKEGVGPEDDEVGVEVADEQHQGEVFSGEEMQGLDESESILGDGDDEGVLFSDSNGYEEKMETLKESKYHIEGDEDGVATTKLNGDQSPEEKDVCFEGKMAALLESEADYRDGDGDLDGTPEKVGNGEILEVNSNGVGLVHEIESNEQISHETGLKQIQDASVPLDLGVDQNARDMKCGGLAQINSELGAVPHSNVINGVADFPEQDKGDILEEDLEANLLLKLQDNPPEEQFGDEQEALDDDLDDASDSGDEAEYDELPPFKRLTKAQLTKLSKAQKKAYFEELEYREKLFFKKQLKEERRRRKLLKKMAETAQDMPSEQNNDNLEEESSGPASVPVPMPDLVLPTSFDSGQPNPSIPLFLILPISGLSDLFWRPMAGIMMLVMRV
ncbi:hypothetical protein J5N97_021919 [Dioscorea zingiberensis]|uniref:Uncharacterized protein n=1 Tax=Dioscorea zingiberensis TaxID=325984 RepID=A0A9D5CAH4_9LILI|nr:hypothetical protein J5N97_021919 [Dioscorea zingiberensis]